MSQQVRTELETRTQQLLQGPLKHIRGAALAAALLPLASIAAAPASAQTGCFASGGAVCGFVFDDANNNGLQDAGEPGIEGVKLILTIGGDTFDIETGPTGIYLLPVQDGTYTIAVEAPMGTQPSPPNAFANAYDSIDSDGQPDTFGRSVTTVTVTGGNIVISDFGFHTTPPSVLNPGTGTPGYWKNHPEAWPVSKITIGGIEYTKAVAIDWLGKVGKDKTTTMFSSLVSARLNVIILNDPQCVSSTIGLADAWMAAHPVGSNVLASSPAWVAGEPLHKWLDAYNNGLLCAPHRN